MPKSDEAQEIMVISLPMMLEVQTHKVDISDVLWRTRDEGMIPLKMIEDSHLKNIALMLIGMGNQQYKTSDENRARWLIILRMEWEKRKEERKHTFKKQ